MGALSTVDLYRYVFPLVCARARVRSDLARGARECPRVCVDAFFDVSSPFLLRAWLAMGTDHATAHINTSTHDATNQHAFTNTLITWNNNGTVTREP